MDSKALHGCNDRSLEADIVAHDVAACLALTRVVEALTCPVYLS
jgi:hypothetical protein